MSPMEGFFLGVFGGILAELLGLFALRHEPPGTLPKWLRSRFYWTLTVLMILAGGGLVVVYLRSNVILTAALAVNIGASAPLMIGTLTRQTPRIDPGRID